MYFMSQKQMREARWMESVVNSFSKREGEKRYVVQYQCGCGCGVFNRAMPLLVVDLPIKRASNKQRPSRGLTEAQWQEILKRRS